MRNIPRGRAFLIWPPFLIAATIAAVALSISAGRILFRARAIHTERETLTQKIDALEARRDELEQIAANVTAPKAVERLAKERLNLKFPGENVVVVTNNEEDAAGGASEGGGWFSAWLADLFDFFRW